MKIEKIIAKLEKSQDKINVELDALRDMLEIHLEEMESNENYEDTEDDSENDEDLLDDEDLDDEELS
jgi:hypothetical protein